MFLSTGVDILEIERIQKSLSNPRFLNRLFGLSEIEQYRAGGEQTSFLAGNFCAKEAFSKALGTGIRGFSLAEVQILRNELGKPYFALSGDAAELVKEKRLLLDVSISHTDTTAVAFVVAWQDFCGN